MQTSSTNCVINHRAKMLVCPLEQLTILLSGIWRIYVSLNNENSCRQEGRAGYSFNTVGCSNLVLAVVVDELPTSNRQELLPVAVVPRALSLDRSIDRWGPTTPPMRHNHLKTLVRPTNIRFRSKAN